MKIPCFIKQGIFYFVALNSESEQIFFVLNSATLGGGCTVLKFFSF